MTPRRALGSVLAMFFALALLYQTATPIFEAPDESYHFFVIQHIRETGSLPVQGAPGDSLYAQEGSQPPLYYLLGAALTAWIDTSDARDYLRENPQANLGDPANPGNKNRYIHTEREALPWRGTPLAVHVLRLFSTALGAIVVACAYGTARVVFPDRPWLAVFASAIVAFAPQFVFISSSVNNDNAVNALAALGVYLLMRMWRGERSGRILLAMSIVAGLSMLAKLGGLLLLAFSIVVVLYLAATRHEWRWGARAIAAMLIGAALISGWWYVRNVQLYGDVTGLNAMLKIVGQRALDLPALTAELPGLWFSTWGVFGWFNQLLPDAVYLAYALFALGAIIGGVTAIFPFGRRTRFSIEPALGLLAWSTLAAFGVLRWTATTPGSQGRLLFPAASALAMLLAAGWWHLAGRRRRAALGTIAAGMLAAAAWTPFGVIGPSYARPQDIALSDVPSDATRLDLDFNGEIHLLGGRVEPDTLRPGEAATVVLYWQALRKPTREYMVSIALLGRSQELVGKEDAYHGDGTYPSDIWRGDEVIADRYVIRLSETAGGPARVRVTVGLRDRTTRQPVRVTTASGQLYAGLIVADEVRLAADGRIAAPQVLLGFRLGDAIELIGYDRPNYDKDNRTIVYRLYWRASRAPGEDYTVFAHLIDAAGNRLGQADSPPFDGDYPTSWWRSGEAFVEERRLPWPDGTSLEGAHILFGLYRPSDLSRLPVRDSTGRTVTDDAVVIETTAP